jgi:hypothetical protein
MVNGEVVTVRGEGTGSTERGSLRMHFEFSAIPPGFSVWCAALYTGCCSTPSFAIEQNGGLNLISLTGGRYRCVRTFDFGRFGRHDYNYRLRLDDSGAAMQARGVIQGDMSLPDIRGVDDSFTEIMIPLDDREIRAFSRTKFVTTDGAEVPVRVESAYQPLTDGDRDWHCCAKNQVRRSFINIGEAAGRVLDLEYSTVIRGIDAPNLPHATTKV